MLINTVFGGDVANGWTITTTKWRSYKKMDKKALQIIKSALWFVKKSVFPRKFFLRIAFRRIILKDDFLNFSDARPPTGAVS